MPRSTDMEELKGAYYDIYDTVEEFVYPDDVVGELVTTRAQRKVYSLFDELLEDGYTKREIRFLSIIAVCDAITDSYLVEQLREEFDNHDDAKEY